MEMMDGGGKKKREVVDGAGRRGGLQAQVATRFGACSGSLPKRAEGGVPKLFGGDGNCGKSKSVVMWWCG